MLHILSILLFFNNVLSSPVAGEDGDMPLNKARYLKCIDILRNSSTCRPRTQQDLQDKGWQGYFNNWRKETDYPMSGQLCTSYGPSVLAVGTPPEENNCTCGYIDDKIQEQINKMSIADFDSETLD